MACVTYGTSKIDGEVSFRIPFGVFFIILIIVSVGTLFMREVCLLRIFIAIPFYRHRL